MNPGKQKLTNQEPLWHYVILPPDQNLLYNPSSDRSTCRSSPWVKAVQVRIRFAYNAP